MAGGAAEGAKFVTVFSVEGDGEAALKRIGQGFQRITDTVDSMSQLAKVGEGTQRAFEKIGEAGTQMLSAGAAGIKMYVGGVMDMMDSLSPFETAMTRMVMVGQKTREEARAIIEKGMETVIYTPFQAEQITNIQEALVAGKVSLDDYQNSAGQAMTLNDAFAAGISRVDQATLDMAGGMKINATTALTDLAAATGQTGYQMTTFVRGMRRALATGNLGMLFDQIPADMREAIFETTGRDMKITAQEAMDNMFDYLSEKGLVGASAMSSATYEGIVSNFKDLPTFLAKEIGGLAGDGGFYDEIRFGMAGVMKEIMKAMTDKDLMKSFKEGLAPVITLFVEGLKLAASGIKGLISVVKENPWLIKFGAIAGLAASAVLTLGGAAVVAFGAIGGLVAAFLTITTVVAPFLPVVLGVAAAFTALALGMAAVGGLSAVMFATNFGGIKDILTDVWVIGKAVYDSLSDWSGPLTSISLESKQALEERGLLGSFLKVINWMRQAETFMEGFGAGFMAKWETVGAKFGKAWDKMSGAFGRIGEAIRRIIGVVSGGLGESQALVDQATSDGMAWGDRAGQVLDVIADVAVGVANAIDMAIASAPDMIRMFADAYETISETWALVKMGGAVFSFWGNAMRAAITPAIGMLLEVKALFEGLSKAAVQTMTGNVIGAGKTLAMTGIEMRNIGKATAKSTLGYGEAAASDLKAIADAEAGRQKARDDADRMREYAKNMEHPGRSPAAARQELSYAAHGAFPVPPQLLGPPPPRDQWADIQAKERGERLERAGVKGPSAAQVSVKTIGNIILDGQKVAEATWEHFKEKLEQAGYHPSTENG